MQTEFQIYFTFVAIDDYYSENSENVFITFSAFTVYKHKIIDEREAKQILNLLSLRNKENHSSTRFEHRNTSVNTEKRINTVI